MKTIWFQTNENRFGAKFYCASFGCFLYFFVTVSNFPYLFFVFSFCSGILDATEQVGRKHRRCHYKKSDVLIEKLKYLAWEVICKAGLKHSLMNHLFRFSEIAWVQHDLSSLWMGWVKSIWICKSLVWLRRNRLYQSIENDVKHGWEVWERFSRVLLGMCQKEVVFNC